MKWRYKYFVESSTIIIFQIVYKVNKFTNLWKGIRLHIRIHYPIKADSVGYKTFRILTRFIFASRCSYVCLFVSDKMYVCKWNRFSNIWKHQAPLSVKLLCVPNAIKIGIRFLSRIAQIYLQLEKWCDVVELHQSRPSPVVPASASPTALSLWMRPHKTGVLYSLFQ